MNGFDASAHFVNTFNEVSKVIEFNPAWSDKTGHFNHLATTSITEPGVMYKCTDKRGRRLLIKSNVDETTDVIFEKNHSTSGEVASLCGHFPVRHNHKKVIGIGGIRIDDDDRWALEAFQEFLGLL